MTEVKENEGMTSQKKKTIEELQKELDAHNWTRFEAIGEGAVQRGEMTQAEVDELLNSYSLLRSPFRVLKHYLRLG